MKSLKTIPVTLALTLTLAMGLAACGKDAKDGENHAGSQASNNASLADASEIKCANPVALDDVPAEWVRVEGKELITGKNGRYELVQVQLHGVMEARDGKKASATTNTVIMSRDLGKDGVVQTVTCKDMGELDKMSLNTKPQDSISLVDGSYNERRAIDFVIRPDSVEKSADVYSVTESARFGEKTDATRAQEEQLRAMGISYDTRTYKISKSEFELRLTVTAPDQQGSGKNITINAALRYKLKK